MITHKERLDRESFVNYLNNTLIPDLEESGMEATAADFREAVFWIEERNQEEE